MAVREILLKGHEALKRKSEEISCIDDEVKNLIRDMFDTLYSTTGIGLAAPQIGVNKRVIIIDLKESSEAIVLINPKILSKKGMRDSEEVCLSYPGYYGYVERPRKVEVSGLNEKGEVKIYCAEGLLCRVLCHEIDHLDGILYTDKAYKVYSK